VAVIDFSLILTAVNNTTTALRGVRSNIEAIGVSARATEVRLRAIQVVFAGIAATKATQITNSFMQTAASIEELQLRVALLTGSWASAGEVIDRVNKRFDGTTASSEDLVKTFTTLAGVGLPVEKAEQLTEAIGQMAIASGRSAESINSVGLAFSKMIEKGDVDVRTLVGNLTQAMPQAVNAMAAAAGKSVTQFVQDVKSGALSADQVIELFIESTNSRFKGLIEIQQSSITGALSMLRNAWRDSVRDLGQRTPINAEVAARMRDLRSTIDGLVSRVTTDEVQRFFVVIDSLSGAAGKVAVSLAPIGSMIVALAEAASNFINTLPKEVVTAGLIGYLVGGRTGMVVFGAATSLTERFFGNIEDKTQGIVRVINDLMPLGIIGLLIGGAKGAVFAVAAAAAFDALLTRWAVATERTLNRISGQNITTIQDQVAEGKTAVGEFMRLFGDLSSGVSDASKETAAAAKKTFENTGKTIDDIAQKQRKLIANPGDAERTRQFLQEMAAAWDTVSTKVSIAKESLDGYEAVLRGDTLGKSLAEANKRYDQQVRSLIEAKKAAEEFTNKYGRGHELVAQINAQLVRTNELRQQENDRVVALNTLLQQRLLFEESSLQVRAEQAALSIRKEFDNGVLSNVRQGATGGIVEQVAERQLSLQAQILDGENQINAQLEKRMNTNNPALILQIDTTIDKYREMIRLSQNAIENLSVHAVLGNQMWQSIGNTIQGGLSNAISGLAMRMNNLRDVGIQMYQSITKAAADYLAKLILIQAASMFFGGPSVSPTAIGNPGTGKGLYANGGVFPGRVVPFANGGIIGGPTLFGLAGEAGAEAIMPLERIGGKLGVRSVGGGGNTIVLQVNAIDQRSGAEFLMKHLSTIGDGLAQRDRLNRGTRKV
jgi:tape measure domain-containing protein